MQDAFNAEVKGLDDYVKGFNYMCDAFWMIGAAVGFILSLASYGLAAPADSRSAEHYQPDKIDAQFRHSHHSRRRSHRRRGPHTRWPRIPHERHPGGGDTMSEGLRDVGAMVGDLATLSTAVQHPVAGPALLEVARRAAVTAAAVMLAPLQREEDLDFESNDWITTASDELAIVMGPDFLLTAAPGGVAFDSIGIRSGEVTWHVVADDDAGNPKDGQGAPSGEVRGTLERLARSAIDRATGGLASAALSSLGAFGPVRIMVTQADGEPIDWAFDHMGVGRDFRDLTEQTESLKAFVDDVVREVEGLLLSLDRSAQQAGEAVLGDQPQMQPRTTVTTVGAGGRGTDLPVSAAAIGSAPVAAVASIASRAIAHSREKADTAEPALLWQATHRVGAHALPVGGVPEGTFMPGTMLDSGLAVQLIGTSESGWALVACSNGWRCYVARWGLEPVS